jgi:membrane carboxypeptidase/penicillin-binding protein PbpC
VVGVWVGNADNEPMRHVSGVTGAAPIWRDVMTELLKGKPAQQFERPAGLVEKEVCAQNGLIPDDRIQNTEYRGQSAVNNSQFTIHNSQFPTRCPHTLTELFIAGTEPTRLDDWHTAIALDRRTGLRAGPGCPREYVSTVTFTRYPAEAQAWAIKQGVSQPPAEYSPLCPGEETANIRNHESTNSPASLLATPYSLVFTSPDQGSVFRLVPNIPAEKQKIRVQVRPTDGVSLREVSLRVNGQPFAAGPEALWQMEPGDYTFEAVGRDAAGNELSARPVSVRVVAFEDD